MEGEGIMIALKEARARTERAYSERNFAAAIIVTLALKLGLKAGQGLDDNEEWDSEWRHVLYVELPDGTQVSWHIAPADLVLLLPLPAYEGEWDGKFMSRDPVSGAALIAKLLEIEAK